jgi:hypothetical protein
MLRQKIRPEDAFAAAVVECVDGTLRPAYAAVRKAEAVLRAVVAELDLRAERGDQSASRIRAWVLEKAEAAEHVREPLADHGAGRQLLAALVDDAVEAEL